VLLLAFDYDDVIAESSERQISFKALYGLSDPVDPLALYVCILSTVA
jgi:hypothetical protein